MTRILIAAASAIVRAGLASVGASGSGIEVVDATGLTGLGAAVDRYLPDVVLASVDGHLDEPPEEVMALAGRDGGPAIVLLSGDLHPA